MIGKGKILIVGQGLAGSILAFELLKNKIPFEIWNHSDTYFTSSLAAGGIFNPVTGRKLENTWLAKELFDYLPGFYKDLEELLQEKFFFPSKMFRPFGNENSKNWLLERKELVDENYVDWSDEEGVWINQAGWVDVPKLLLKSRDYFQSLGIYKEIKFEHEWISNPKQKSFQIQGVEYERIIFAEGFHAQNSNPFFKNLCYLPAKGELLQISIPNYSQNYILSKNGFLFPIKDDLFKVGATYRWNEFTNQSTEDSLEELKDKLRQFGIENYTILQQEVGVRPATQDRRPFIGFLPDSNLGIFNGFGSKGVSLIPYFAKEFLKEWSEEKNLPNEVSIRRFYI